MHKLLQKLKLFYKTELLFSHGRTLRVYGVMTFITFMILGVFGVFPQILSISDKVVQYREIKNKQTTLTKKLAVLKEYEEFMIQNASAISNVYNLRPELPRIDEFVVELVAAGGVVGFETRQVQVTPGDGVIGIRVTGVGSSKDLALYIKNIESLKRIAKVQTISFFADVNDSGKEYSYTIDIEIYTKQVL